MLTLEAIRTAPKVVLHDHLDGGLRPGTVIDLAERPGFDDVVYPIIVVRKDDGDEIAVHAFHAVLRAKLAENKPAIGDRIAIRYEGKIKAKTEGHPAYHGYSVVVESADDLS